MKTVLCPSRCLGRELHNEKRHWYALWFWAFGLLSGCATETSVRDESDALKVLLAGVETRFLDEHTTLAEALNEQKAMTNAQRSLLEALWGEVKTMNEKVDVLCSHTDVLGTSRGMRWQSLSLFKAWTRRQTA